MKHAVLAAALGLVCVGCGGVDKAKLEPVYRSAKALEAGTGVGVSYLKFSELLQQLGTAVAIARDQVSNDAERAALAHYASAIPIYQDSVTLWALKVDQGTYLSYYGRVADLATKYAIRRESTGTINAEDGLQIIWITAGVSLAKGHLAYGAGR